jgi:CheY-like chemotaxis protein
MADQSRLSVLVVDNDGDLAETLKDFLEGQGYSVTCSASAEGALRGLRAGHHADVMLVDFALSAMTGVDLLDICSADAELARLPVILMTGFPREHLRAGLRCHVLTKPFDLEQMLAAITTAAIPDERRPPSW